jgi:hypothetical protein
MPFWVASGPVYHSENMTKLKQVLFAAGLVTVGYRLGAKSPAAAAPGSAEFRDEVAPSRKPSSKPGPAHQLQVVPSAAKPKAPSEFLMTFKKNSSAGTLVYDCASFEKNWLDTRVYPHLQSPKEEDLPQLNELMNEHLAQALHISNHWRGTARFMIGASAVSVDVLYKLKVDDVGRQCWDMQAFSAQDQDVYFLSGSGACGESFQINWINGKPLIRVMTNFLDGVGALISGVLLPLDPAGFDGQFEYMSAAEDKWIAPATMMFQPLSEETAATVEKEFFDKIDERRSAVARLPASDR